MEAEAWSPGEKARNKTGEILPVICPSRKLKTLKLSNACA
jgi:hypothetical protein